MEMTPEQQQALAIASARLRLNDSGGNAPPGGDMSAGEVATGAAKNLWPSAKRFASDMVQPLLHPIDTHTNLSKTVAGGIQKLTGVREGGEDYTKYADAVGHHFTERYGGIENAKRAFAADPVGVLADASILFTAGGAAAARLPGTLGKIGEVAGTVGRAIDPISAVASTVKGAGNVAAKVTGFGTGSGARSVKDAAASGFTSEKFGGAEGQSFRDNLRGVEPIENVVTDMKTATGNMRKERGSNYVADMAAIGGDPAILNFQEVQRGLNRSNSIKQFKGQELEPQTAKVRKEINDAVDHWKTLDPAQYHTAVGFDALKQKIGAIKDSLPFNSPERAAADHAYNAIRQTIVKQAPEYARVMSEYEKASNQIEEITKALSLGKKASKDTTLRKAQSITRNNVNTNYGNRVNMAEKLAENGAPHLMEKLAGQSMNSWTPRGLMGLGLQGSVTAALAALHPGALLMAPLQSPRLVGEVAHFGGRVAGKVSHVAEALAAPLKARKQALVAERLSEQ